MKYVSISVLFFFVVLTSIGWAAGKPNSSKPLAGYKVITVEPFVIENGERTKDFPVGEEVNLQRTAIDALRAGGIFENVIDGSQTSDKGVVAADPSGTEGRVKLILSTTIVAYDKGNSGARFMTWPLPVGVSKVKARFVFRDAANNEQVFSLEKEAKFQATVSAGIASQDGQMTHLKEGLADSLVKEIKHNR